MNDATKVNLENSLRGYWKNIQKLYGLYNSLQNIDKNIQDLRGILAEKEDLIPSPNQMRFIPGGGRGGSTEFTPIEQAALMYEMNQTKIYEKIQQLRARKVKIKWRILDLENKTDWITYIQNVHLDKFEQQVFEQCYAYRRSNVQVGIALNCDESTVRRKREKILCTFYEFLRLRA